MNPIKKCSHHLIILLTILIAHGVRAQLCDPSTPSFVANLSGDPNGTYTSPAVIRNGFCCGASGNVKCIEFIVTLHPDAEGVIFDIISGAVPGGALFYQINCGPPESVGQVICLSGVGPHVITFCKPGNNVNEYRILSVAEPVIPDSIYVNDGCTKQLGTIGFDEPTIVWNTVSPGAPGAFNHYLDCLSGCDTINVTPQPGYPPFLDIEVCGFPFGGCDTVYICDTVRVNIFSTLDVNINPEQPTVCFGNPGTTISAIPSGGSPPYSYVWSTGATTQNIFVGVGTYWVELSDSSGCPPTYDTVVVTSFSLPIEAIAGKDTVSCVQDFPIPIHGSIVAASGGIWYGNGTFTPDSATLEASYMPTQTEITNGFATVMLVTTGNGSCPADTDYVNISLLEFNATVTTNQIPVSCVGDADGKAIASATGTRSPFSFQWGVSAASQTNDTARLLPAGFYSVTVTDSAGCALDTVVEVIEADSALVLDIITTPVSCFGGSDGIANLVITGGVPPYTTTWDPLITSFTNTTATGLPAGSYAVSIIDDYGCQIDTTFTIIEPALPVSVALTKVDVGCKNGSDGTATATPSGGTPGYTYAWSAGTGFQTTPTASGLPAGTYSVVITDSAGCTTEDSIVLNQPASTISFTAITTQPTCHGGNDGTATVFPSGGTPPYTFLWDSAANSQTTQTATGLFADTFSVIISDVNGCIDALPIIVTDPPPLFATAVEIVHVSCKGGSNGSAKVIPTGGNPPYTYQWSANAGSQTDSIATNLSAGIYTVQVNDQNGCSFVPDIEILEPNDSISVIATQIPVTCKGGSDGKALANGFGGTLPYTFTWGPAAGSQVSDTALNLSAGTYTVQISDSNNCTADTVVTVTEPPLALAVTLLTDSIQCFGDSNGLAVASLVGGVPPYTIQWGPGTGNQVGDSAKNLGVGTYQVAIVDQNNCAIDSVVNIFQPLPIVLTGSQQDILCFGDNTGWAQISASGGNGGFNYQWDANTGSQTGDSALNLLAGAFQVTATDVNGCTADSVFVLTQPPTPLSLTSGAKDVNCFGGADGKAFVMATGGTGPYNYQWAANAGSQVTDTAFNLSAGVYMITVTDNVGCADNLAVVVDEPNSPLAMIMGKKNVTCFEGTDGQAYAGVAGGTKPYYYSWTTVTGPKISDTARNLTTGMAYLTLTDTNGCTINDSIMINQPQPVTINISPSDTICKGDSMIIAMAGAGGNGGPFTYQLLPSTTVPQTFVVHPQTTKQYGFQAIDQFGCKSQTALVTVYVQDLEGDALDITASGDICLGDTVEITAVHQGLYGPYTYKWNSGQISLGFKATPTQSRYYTLSVIDHCGVEVRDSVPVQVFPIPKLDLDPIIAVGCVPLTVTFTNNLSDPLITEYTWSFGDGNISIDPNPVYTYTKPGKYQILAKVENVHGCENENIDSSYVRVFANPRASFTAQPSVVDLRNPIIQFLSGSSEGIHQWSFGDEDTSSLRNPLHFYQDTGRYLVRLHLLDSNACTDSAETFVIVNPYFNIQIPNAFTPNPAGSSGGRYDPSSLNNYVFYPYTEGVEQFNMLIFNRWGELIFESNDPNIGWDGYYRGKLVSQEVYVWKLDITWENGQHYEGAGDVTVIR